MSVSEPLDPLDDTDSAFDSSFIIDSGLFIGICLFAFILRLVYVFQMSNSPLFSMPILDGELHDQWARMMLAGQTLFQGAYFKAPLYPAFLAAVYKVAGFDYLAPRLAQAFIGAASCGLLFLLGKEAFNRIIGAIAGLAAATYWIMIFFDAELLLEPLSIFFNLLALWLMMRAAKGQRLWIWLLAGLALGLSAITRPNVLVFMPPAALWVLWLYWGNQRIAWSRGILFGLGCVIPIVPITIRNYVAGHEFVLIASQGGPNFYIGNNIESDGMSARLPGSRSSLAGGVADWVSIAQQEQGRKLKASEVDNYY